MSGAAAVWKSAGRGSEWRPCLLVVVVTLAMVAAFVWSIQPDADAFARHVRLPIFRRLLVDDWHSVPWLIATGLLGVAGARWAGRRALSLAWLVDYPRAVALAVSTLCCAICVVAYRRHALSMDEAAPLFQARVFAAGALSAVFEPSALRWLFYPPFLGGFFTASTEGQVTSVYGPGFALALAPFAALGLGFVVNPLLAGGSAWLLRHVGLRLFEGDRQLTGVAVALLIASPAFIVNAASFYSMNAHLFANLAFMALLLQPSPKRLLLAGAVGAWALSLHNPFPHLLFAWPWWLGLLRAPGRGRRVLSLAAGYVFVGAVLVVGWSIYRGGLRPPNASPGGPFPFVAPSLDIFGYRLQGLGKLVLWAPFGMIPLAVVGAVMQRARPVFRQLSWSVVATIAGYLVVTFDQGHGWGYRYFHAAYAALPLLAAAALQQAVAGARPWLVLANATVYWAALSLTLLVPQRALQVHSFVSDHLKQLVDTRRAAGECVHFINQRGYYAVDLIQNAPSLKGRELFLTDHGDLENQALLAHYLPQARRHGATHSDTAFCAASLERLKAAFLRNSRSD